MNHPHVTRINISPAAGHEYTLGNLLFGATCGAEIDNSAIIARLRLTESLRSLGLPTVPTTVDVEKLTNVFVRTALRTKPIEHLAKLRAAKDTWRGL